MELRSIVQTYVTDIRPLVSREVGWYENQPTLAEAIRTAALCITSRGTRHPHCRRKSRAILEKACCVLLANEQCM